MGNSYDAGHQLARVLVINPQMILNEEFEIKEQWYSRDELAIAADVLQDKIAGLRKMQQEYKSYIGLRLEEGIRAEITNAERGIKRLANLIDKGVYRAELIDR